MNKLAIYAPNLGAVSESFIRRHMEDLLPSETVLIVGSNKPPYNGHWDVDAPKIILPEMSELLHLDLKNKVFLHSLSFLNIKARSNLYYNKKVEKFLVDNQVKVILGEYLDVSTTIIDLAHKLGIKVFAHAHGYDISIKLKEKFWRQQYLKLNNIDAIITMSNYSKKALMKVGIKEELIHVIPYGVNVPPAFVKEKSGQPIKCIAVGRMVLKKAPLKLLEAFRDAAQENPLLTLTYIGQGDLYESAVEYVKKHQLEDKVKLLGALPNTEVVKHMKEADLFLQHSVVCPLTGDEEGLPVSILEAMAHYLPVVATNHAGIPEAVLDGQNGFIVEEGDVKLMAEKIVLLSRNAQLRQDMGQAARKTVEEKFTWRVEREGLLKLMQLSTKNVPVS
ncbi:glycosyltransferase family 4 protein [Spirosoma aerophilum]